MVKLIRHGPAIGLRYQIAVLTDFLYSLSTQTIRKPVLILVLGIDFSLEGVLGSQLKFPSERNSLSPVKLAVEVINTFSLSSFLRDGRCLVSDGRVVARSFSVLSCKALSENAHHIVLISTSK